MYGRCIIQGDVPLLSLYKQIAHLELRGEKTWQKSIPMNQC